MYAGFNTNALGIDYQMTTFSPKVAVLLQNDFSSDLILVTNFVGDYLTIDNNRTIGYITTLTYAFTPRFSAFGEHQGMFTHYTKNYEIGGGLAYLFSKDLQLGLNFRTDHQLDYLNIYGGLGLSYRIDRHVDKMVMMNSNQEGSGKIQYKKEGFFKRLFSKKSRRGKKPSKRKSRKLRKTNSRRR